MSKRGLHPLLSAPQSKAWSRRLRLRYGEAALLRLSPGHSVLVLDCLRHLQLASDGFLEAIRLVATPAPACRATHPQDVAEIQKARGAPS